MLYKDVVKRREYYSGFEFLPGYFSWTPLQLAVKYAEWELIKILIPILPYRKISKMYKDNK